MAGIVTIAESIWSGVKKVVFDWTSGTGADINKADGVTVNPYEGVIGRILFIPDAVAVPTNLYDVRILDSDGIDVAAGNGIDLLAAAARECFPHSALYPIAHMIAHTKLTLEVRNAGDTKKGRVVVYLR
jgi:hypothetical protein